MTLKILAVDTATENCSVALCVGDAIISRCEMVPREHTTRILPLVDEVLSDAGLHLSQLDALAFGRGPGSFTGVRIGIGVAQGLAFGADLPVVGVSTLMAMAQQAHRKHNASHVLTAIDARMNEIYFAGYVRNADGDWIPELAEMVTLPENVVLPVLQTDWYTVGTGWQAYPELASQLMSRYQSVLTLSSVLYPEAVDMLDIAKHAFERNEVISAEHASPVYLRDTVTWKKLPGRE